MQHIKTLAMEINEKTYPIAVACLPPAFMSVVPKDAYGNILIINNEETVMIGDMRSWRTTLDNVWMSREDFDYSFDTAEGEALSDFFFEVVKVVR